MMRSFCVRNDPAVWCRGILGGFKHGLYTAAIAAAHQWRIAGQHLCIDCAGLYHDLWYYQAHQLCAWRYLYGRCIYRIFCNYKNEFFHRAGYSDFYGRHGSAGMLVEKLAYKPLRHAPRISVLITAIGVSFFLEYTSMYFVSPTPRTFPAVFDSVAINIGPLVINGQQMLILGITCVLMVLLTYIVQKTKIGKAMRAASFDTETAQLMGIDSDRVISITFGIGSALAAVAGVLVGVYYNSIDPLMGIMPGLKAFVAAVLGGIGILPGAVAGGIILGVVEALVSGFLSSTFRDAAAFAILILVLLFKPSGLFGKNTREKV